MNTELSKFKNQNTFTFTQDDSLEVVCNAPESGSGVFIVVVGGEVEGEQGVVSDGEVGECY